MKIRAGFTQEDEFEDDGKARRNETFSITWPRGEARSKKDHHISPRGGEEEKKRPATMAIGVACARKLGAWCGPNGAKETGFSAAWDRGPHRPLHMLEPVEKLRRRGCRDPVFVGPESLTRSPTDSGKIGKSQIEDALEQLHCACRVTRTTPTQLQYLST